MRSCRLISLLQTDDSISVLHLQTLVIGRGPLTRIRDPRLSRNHIKLLGDLDKGTLHVKLLGANSCRAGNKKLITNESIVLKHGDCIELLEGQYPYRVEFIPNPIEQEALPGAVEEMAGKQTTLNNFFKRKSVEESEASNNPKKLKTEDTWEEIDGGKLIIYRSEGVNPSQKIAAFDLDGTIITTKSGKVFPVNSNDWKLLFPEIPRKLMKLREEGFKIVFFTNQAGLTNGKVNPKEFRQKLADIQNKLQVPIQAFIAPGTSIYRKPTIGMWKHLVDKANGGLIPDMDVSFYCGDAAGRPEKWAPGKKKDHSCVDRLMAINAGLKFYTPEEYFLGQKPSSHREPEFNPKAIDHSVALLEPADAPLYSDKQEVILLVGFPGSGKSHFAAHHSAKSNYDVVNRDSLGTWQKCAAAVERSLDAGKSVLIDNTNPDKESRARFIRLATSRGLQSRCFIMNTNMTHARHNNKFRELTDDKHAPVSRMIFNVYKSKYQEPCLDEGLNQIVRVNFRPRFSSAEAEQLYNMFLLED